MLTTFELLEQEAFDLGIHVDQILLAENDQIDGLYINTRDGTHIILLNRFRPESVKVAVMAEELGHFYTAYGDIIDQRHVANRKAELRGRQHAYRRLIPEEVIGDLIQSGARAFYEIAEALCLPENFIREAYAYYLATG